MGLDITAHERIKRASVPANDDEERERAIYVYNIKKFEDHAKDLDAGGWYESVGKQFSFHAGSYSSYNWWREQLSIRSIGIPVEQVWEQPDLHRRKPFYLILNYADNEGIMGPAACSTLASEFEEHRDRIFELPNTDEDYFRETYERFLAGFKLAAGEGCVKFH